MKTVTKKGHEDWHDLLGKKISFSWSDGWEDYGIHGTFEGTQPYADDPRYPRYYILINSGGVSVWEGEEVTVQIEE